MPGEQRLGVRMRARLAYPRALLFGCLLAPACVGTVSSGPGEPAAGGGTGGSGATTSTPGPGKGTPTAGTSATDPTTMPSAPAAPGAFVPGAAPMRRLTREQYENTVADLLGINYAATAQLSGDELAAGFRANSGVALKELQVEEYQSAAETIATQAVAPAKLKTLVPCLGTGDETTCVNTFIASFGKRAFRRPLSADEVTRYRKPYDAGRQGADAATGIATVVQAMLQSPHFLYRPEVGLPTPRPDGGLNLSPYEVATRLSYFLWNTMPDDALFAAADANQLNTSAQLDAHVTRMLKDTRAAKTLASFVEQWLDLGDLPTIERDKSAQPLFSPELRSALREEISRFVDKAVREGDGRIESLLTTRQSVINGPLSQLYGLTTTLGDAAAWKTTELPTKQRGGLLTLAGVMATHSHPDQTSLVRRGYMVRAKLLCQTPPPAPPDLMITVPKVDPTLSARARFEQHRANPRCANCHALMDPLGAPFEVYDPLGRFRTMDGTQKVDSSGSIDGTAASDGAVSDPVELMSRLSTSVEVRDCLVKQFFRYAFARMDAAGDAATLASAGAAVERNEHRVTEAFRGIVTSDAFRTRAFDPQN